MKLTSILALGGFAVTTLAQFNITSKPFYLRLSSHDEKYDGQFLVAGHEGAAIEGLILYGKDKSDAEQFAFNTSYYPGTFDPSLGEQGYLVWELEGSNFKISEPLALTYDAITNLALPQFKPAEYGDLFAFDEDNKLNIQGYVDDSVYPPTVGPQYALYNWFACQTYYSGYNYTSVAWVVGKYPVPQNPTCCKVDVERVFS